MSKVDNKDKSAFPGRVNAMGYEGGLTKLEFISALILSAKLGTEQLQSTQSAAQDSVKAAKILIGRLQLDKDLDDSNG